MLQAEPNITSPFEISVALYASKTRKAQHGSLLDLQVAPKWLQKIIPTPLEKKFLKKVATMAHKV